MSHPPGPKPLILVIDEDQTTLELIKSELTRRYSRDYTILCTASKTLAEEVLRERDMDSVAIVMVDQALSRASEMEFLLRCHQMHPRSKRLLLVTIGNREALEVLGRAMALGHADYFLRRPMRPGDEHFHRGVAEMLDEWATLGGHHAAAVQLIAEEYLPRAHEIRDLLQRNGVPFHYLASDSEEGHRLLDETGVEAAGVPVMVLFDGQVLVDPTNAQAANALGASVKPGSGPYDVAIVGGGPAGLAAAVYGASEGLRTIVLEREAVGGQAGTSARIRNYLGFPHGLTGVDLAQRAYEQAWLFGADFAFMQEASVLRPADGGYEILTKAGDRLRSRSVILSTGVSYRRLAIEGLDRLVGMGVFYGAAASEAAAAAGNHVYIVGGGNSAGQAAVYLARYAKKVSILVRDSSLAVSMSDYLIQEIGAASNVEVLYNREIVDGGGEGRLQWLTVLDRTTGERSEHACEALFVLIGAQAHTDWLPSSIVRDRWGFIMTGRDLDTLAAGWPLAREPLHLETSCPGVFAAGDIRHRSVKRVASAVGEGSVAIQMIHRYLEEADAPSRAVTRTSS